jgi:hypothetical protein
VYFGIAAYFLKARIIMPEEQPLLDNSSVRRRNGAAVGNCGPHQGYITRARKNH